MIKDIKKALEHCIEWNCADCPNREELGSGETVCRGRLFPYVLEYVYDLEAKLAESEKELKEELKEKNGVKRALSACNRQNDEFADMIKKLVSEKEELKQQLAEKDKTIENLRIDLKYYQDLEEKISTKYDKVVEKLAEKEKEIEEVRSNHANLVADIAYKAVNVYTAESKKTGVPTFYKIHYSQLLKIEDMENLRNYAQDKISFAVEQLEKVKEYALELFKKFCQSIEYHSNKSLVGRRFIEYYPFNDFIDQQIKQLKEKK